MMERILKVYLHLNTNLLLDKINEKHPLIAQKKHTCRRLNIIFLLFLAVMRFFLTNSWAQTSVKTDSLNVQISDSLFINSKTAIIDSIIVKLDSIVVATDSIAENKKNKSKKEKSKSIIENKIDRKAKDSIVQDLKNKKVYLFNESEIVYGNIKVTAYYIEIDFEKNTLFARGQRDSTGKLFQTPVFEEGGQIFESEEMTYNFDTKKGIISKVFTEDGSGYLHGTRIKKMEDNTVNIRYGSYTTCNNKEHPHFEFRFQKAKVIPDNKIVTGPAYFTIESVPTPAAVPFGLFPNKKGQQSGIIIPSYGESSNRGFYFENGGYYWAINDYMDLQMVGDIYTRGSWAIKPEFRYIKRYKYNGYLNASYAINKLGSEGSADYQKSNDFQIRWVHKQDAKARPNGRFSADVFIVSSNYNKYNPTTTQNYLSNEFKSSVAYQTSWNGKYFLTLNGSHRQNTLTKKVDITLPEITFSVNQFFPLERKERTGRKKWFENLNVSYTTNMRNSISVADSLLFKSGWEKQMQNGIQHRVPINLPIKLLKHFTLSNAVSVTDRMYFDYKKKYWSNDTLFSNNDTIVGYLKTDTLRGFRNLLDFNFSSTLSTKLYGMIQFKKGPVRAIRHVFTPRVGFTYTPDFGSSFWNYYGTYVDQYGEEQLYSYYEGAIYGSPPNAKSGRITFGFSNNLEIKVPSRKDTITGLRKVVLIKDLSLNGSYDLARDSLNFSYISISGNTQLFKRLNITYSSSWDPYVLDENGHQINKFEWTENRRLLRKTATTWNFGLNLRISHQDFKRDKNNASSSLLSDADENHLLEHSTEQELFEIETNPSGYVDWETPWSINFNYNLRKSNNILYLGYVKNENKKTVQTLGFTGEVNITAKWKFTFQSGWDFETKKLSYTSVNVYRDLHCWELRFNWIPIGYLKSWNLTINVKASVLQDLKLSKKKDFRDI
ncbi:MAG: hypothetical protein LBM67_03325 [Lentimicrobiaceae bacterium]|nr:hypothetical protein [Lentimicrobiaceae bacterium]